MNPSMKKGTYWNEKLLSGFQTYAAYNAEGSLYRES